MRVLPVYTIKLANQHSDTIFFSGKEEREKRGGGSEIGTERGRYTFKEQKV